MKIKESAENYLEAIYMLKKKNGQVRSIDIATHLQFSKPSISYAMKRFREDGYITMDKGGLISLTEKGTKVAERVYERHRLLSKYLISLGVSEETAIEDACRMEHVISEETFEKMKASAAMRDL
jgi:DtxR family Mn-dependent transcriptional regulator